MNFPKLIIPLSAIFFMSVPNYTYAHVEHLESDLVDNSVSHFLCSLKQLKEEKSTKNKKTKEKKNNC